VTARRRLAVIVAGHRVIYGVDPTLAATGLPATS
jgi:hypothetical protein